MLLNDSPKIPKTVNAKTVSTSLFIFLPKKCWLLILFPMGEIYTSFLSSKIQASHFTTEYNFKHAKSGSSQNCKYIKITDRVKADGDSKQQGCFIHLFLPLLPQQTFTGSFIYLSANIYWVLRPLLAARDIKQRWYKHGSQRMESRRGDRHVNK